MWSTIQLLVLCSLLVATLPARIRRHSRYNVKINRSGTANRPCTRYNVAGICVHESACDDDHKIYEGGVLDLENDFRELAPSKCPDRYWCCIPAGHNQTTSTERQTTDRRITNRKNIYKQTENPYQRTTEDTWAPLPTAGEETPAQGRAPEGVDYGNEECLALKTDICPWCVSLFAYDSNSDLEYSTRAPHPFCLGALVGSRAIITSATCLRAADHKTLYAQLPNSPWVNYTVLERRFHPSYNTGTHEHDIGLVVLDRDASVQRATAGACLDFAEPLEGRPCVAYGFDGDWRVSSTIMRVKNQSCRGTDLADAACGTSQDEVCLAENGSPVICQANKGLVLRGIVRGRCTPDAQAPIGNIMASKLWIENGLNSIGINKEQYTSYNIRLSDYQS